MSAVNSVCALSSVHFFSSTYSPWYYEFLILVLGDLVWKVSQTVSLYKTKALQTVSLHYFYAQTNSLRYLYRIPPH